MTWPTTVDLDGIGVLLRQEIPANFEDLNSHVNVRHHYALHMEGAEQAFENLFGIGPEWVAETGHSTFTMAQHVQFHHEILVGHEVSVHMRVLDASPKIVHVLSVLANRTTGEVASTIEYVEAYVDLAARRVTAMPTALAVRVGAFATQHADLSWELPLSGRLGTKRPSQEGA